MPVWHTNTKWTIKTTDSNCAKLHQKKEFLLLVLPFNITSSCYLTSCWGSGGRLMPECFWKRQWTQSYFRWHLKSKNRNHLCVCEFVNVPRLYINTGQRFQVWKLRAIKKRLKNIFFIINLKSHYCSFEPWPQETLFWPAVVCFKPYLIKTEGCSFGKLHFSLE